MTPSTSTTYLAVLLLITTPLVAGCANLDKPGGSSDEPATGQAEGESLNATGADRNASTGPSRDEAPWSGAWLGAWPNEENRALSSFHEQTGSRLDVVDLLVSWNTSYDSTRPVLVDIAASGARPLITWSPTNLTTEQLADGTTTIHLADNETMSLDAYVASWADGLCRFVEHTGKTPLLEPMPEPNGNWHAWSVGYTGPDGEQPNTDESYQRAWTHVHDVFTDRCADGATFVWTINGANAGPGTSYLGAYPGEDATDLAGIRGLNLGAFQERGWASFGATVGHAYCNVTQETELDVVLTGLGSVEQGGDKPQWIREAFANASSHAWHRIVGVVWYDDEITAASGERIDVGVSSSQASLAAYREAVGELGSGEIPDGSPPPC